MGTIYISSKKKPIITRSRNGGGIIRLDEEACDIIEGTILELKGEISVKELASALIKHAANDNIIKEGK